MKLDGRVRIRELFERAVIDTVAMRVRKMGQGEQGQKSPQRQKRSPCDSISPPAMESQ
jgi:hypothetical protein